MCFEKCVGGYGPQHCQMCCGFGKNQTCDSKTA
jgi:hypothetical protein